MSGRQALESSLSTDKLLEDCYSPIALHLHHEDLRIALSVYVNSPSLSNTGVIYSRH